MRNASHFPREGRRVALRSFARAMAIARRLLVTSALPYANGPVHIGHLVEHIQTNIFVRFQRMMGRKVLYVCGDDTHGTSIMIRARQEGRREEELIASVHTEHHDPCAPGRAT